MFRAMNEFGEWIETDDYDEALDFQDEYGQLEWCLGWDPEGRGFGVEDWTPITLTE